MFRHSWVVGLLMIAAVASARNVDLSTVPKRDTVQLTIYNSEDLTLVKETRTITFKKGVNPLQFSWANTLIDPTSVELRFLNNADKLELLDTTFPHDKPQMLFWNVKSEFDGEAKIQITYFTSGITWSADYTAISDVDERTIAFEGFVRVFNNSGEEYEDAQVRLVVGTVNLVEKIAQLARMPMERLGEVPADQMRGYRDRAMKDMVTKGEVLAANGAAARLPQEAKQIVKEGLSEYFIFTIEGTETIPNGWSKRLRSVEANPVPFKIQYRYRPREYGDQLVRMYLMTNDVPSKLGQSPLPDGVVRVFRNNGKGGLSYLTQQVIKYIPIGDKIELNLGVDPEVVFELIKLKAWRDNLWLAWRNGTVVRRVDDGVVDVDINATMVGWDEHAIYTQRIRNYTTKPIEVEIRRSYGGHIDFKADLPGLKSFDFQTPEYTVSVKPAEKANFLHEVILHQGRNAKQNNVTIVKRPVSDPAEKP